MGLEEDSPGARAAVTTVVFVHGIGQQVAGATLMDWAEPICRVMDRRAREAGGRLLIERSQLAGDDAHVRLSISGGQLAGRQVRLLEARWSQSFLVMKPEEVTGWARRFMFGAVTRVVVHGWQWRYPIGAGVRRSWERFVPEPGKGAGGGQVLAAALGLLWLFTVGVALLLIVASVVAAALLLPVVLLLVLVALFSATVLARLPWVGPRVRPLLVALVNNVGDAAAWTSRPVRAAAMRDVVRAKVRMAQQEPGSVVLVGHSQGAAVCFDALFARDDPHAVKVACLITLGAGVSLLQNPRFPGAEDSDFTPVRTWSRTTGTRWINIWGLWDPVSTGPIVDAGQDRHQRWQELYEQGLVAARAKQAKEAYEAELRGLRYDALHPSEPNGLGRSLSMLGINADAEQALVEERGIVIDVPEPPAEDRPRRAWSVCGPEEWPVHNRCSLLTDHVTYTSNIVQVIEPLADVVLGLAQDPAPTAAEQPDPAASERRHRVARTVKELALSRVLAILSAALLTPAALRFLSRQGLISDAYGVIGRENEKVADALGWFETHGLQDHLTVASVMLMLSLVLLATAQRCWLSMYESVSWSEPRSLAWRRAPLRALNALGATFVAWSAVTRIVSAPLDVGVGTAAIAGLIMACPWVGVLPDPVPARRHVEDSTAASRWQ